MPDVEVQMPRYPHDCVACQFLGWRDQYDVWYCHRQRTAIERYGDGHQYHSYPQAVWNDPTIRRVAGEAIRRARLALGAP